MKAMVRNAVGKITENTLISLHVVVMIIGLVIWVVRLGDKVDSIQNCHEKLTTLERRVYRLELTNGVQE